MWDNGGTVKGDNIAWKDTETTPYGEYTTTYKGDVNVDTMCGLVERGRNTFEWKATRKSKIPKVLTSLGWKRFRVWRNK